MLNSKNFVSYVKSRFPLFEVEKNIEKLITVVGGEFKDYLVNNMANEPVVNNVVKFINEMVDNLKTDESIAPFLSEIILGLYDQNMSEYDFFKEKLSIKAKAYFDYSIKLWKQQG